MPRFGALDFCSFCGSIRVSEVASIQSDILGRAGYNLTSIFMSQDRLIKLVSKEAKGQVIMTTKNKKTTQKKLSLKKYSKKLRKHVTFNEAKK